MDFVTSRHSEYRELVRLGVRCGKLHRALTGQNTWHLQCFMDKGLTDKESAKRAVEQYVRSQWEGGLIRFYKKPNSNQEEFWCMFVSYAL